MARKNISKTKMKFPSQKILNTYELLKSGKSVDFQSMVDALGVKPVTAMVFVCALRFDFGAEIETERDGRKVKSYRLTNAADIASSMVLKPKAAATPKAAKTVVAKTKAPKVKATKTVTRVSKSSESPNIDSEFDVSEVTDAELADLKLQLGLG